MYFVFYLLILTKNFKEQITCNVVGVKFSDPLLTLFGFDFSIAEIFDLQWFWQEAVQMLNQSLEPVIKGIKRLGWQWKHHTLPMNTAGWVNAMPADNRHRDKQMTKHLSEIMMFVIHLQQPYVSDSSLKKPRENKQQNKNEWLLPCDFLTMFMCLSSSQSQSHSENQGWVQILC